MNKTYPDGHYAISQDVFCKNSKKMLCVINHGQVVNNIITYVTRDGEQNQSVFRLLDSSIHIFPVDEIDVKDSLHYWYRKNPKHNCKKLVKDDDLVIGEMYQMYGWAYGIMLSYDDDNIYYKIIFE